MLKDYTRNPLTRRLQGPSECDKSESYLELDHVAALTCLNEHKPIDRRVIRFSWVCYLRADAASRN